MARKISKKIKRDPSQVASDEESEQALNEAVEVIEEERDSVAQETSEAADSELSPAALAKQLETLREQLGAREVECEEATDRALRLRAEFENFRQRSIKEKQESLQYGAENLITDLLATVDNLERALEQLPRSGDAQSKSVVEGIELVQSEFLSALGKQGVKEINPDGEIFDPNLHEAVAKVPDGSVAPNTVVEVLQKGYLLRDRLLRPARVVLAQAESGAAPAAESDTS